VCGAGPGTRHSRRWPGRLSSEGTIRQGPGGKDLMFGKGKKKQKVQVRYDTCTKEGVKKGFICLLSIKFYYLFFRLICVLLVDCRVPRKYLLGSVYCTSKRHGNVYRVLI